MPKFEAEQLSVKIRWQFKFILSSLPFPGTKSFGALVREFQSFGLTPQGISLHTPTNNLGETSLEIMLLNYRASVLFDYSSLEVVVNNLLVEEDDILLRLLQGAFNVMKLIEGSTEEGRGTTIVSAHLRLLDDNISDFLTRMVKKEGEMKHLVPDAMAFRIELDDLAKQSEARIVLAKSVKYENAIFTEMTYNFGSDSAEAAIEFHQKITNHYKAVFGIFDLQESLGSKEGT